MDIYWIQDQEKKGPLPEVEVLSMLESGLIPGDVKAWHYGCHKWMNIRDLPALKGALVEKEDDMNESQRGEAIEKECTAENVETVGKEGGKEGELRIVVPYAYVRFLGRLADVMMFATLYFGVLRGIGMGFNPIFLPGSYESLLLFCLPMVLVETLFLSTVGTTPGKALLGVTVRDYRGKKLSFAVAFKRSLFVMVLGVGCFAPALLLLGLSFGWWWVRRFGFTPWDRKFGTTDILNSSVTFRKLVMTVVLILLCLQGIRMLLLPWVPALEAYMEAFGQM